MRALNRGARCCLSTSAAKDSVSPSGRKQNRGIMRCPCGGVSLEPAFVADLDISGKCTVDRRGRLTDYRDHHKEQRSRRPDAH